MLGSFRSPTQPSKKQQEEKQGREWFGVSFKPENFIPGQFISFILGFFLDLSSKPTKTSTTNKKSKTNLLLGNHQSHTLASPNTDHQELKKVLVVRQDLKVGPGKIASQCAHAATGMYSELMQSQQSLLRQWELCGQPR